MAGRRIRPTRHRTREGQAGTTSKLVGATPDQVTPCVQVTELWVENVAAIFAHSRNTEPFPTGSARGGTSPPRSSHSV